MKVLFKARPDLYTIPGGDTVQINETANHLRYLNVVVDVMVGSDRIDYNKYDLMHLFNIIDPEDLLVHAIRSEVPYLVSPIYVNYSEYDKYHRNDVIGKVSSYLAYDSVEYIKTIGKVVLNGEKVSTWKYFIKGHKGSIKYILDKAACVLPNSQNEYRRLTKDYGIENTYFVVPNAVNPKEFVVDESVKRDTVICVGRIEGRKNQLHLIRAMNNTGIQVMIIGYASKNQAKYVSQCKQEAASNIHFYEQMDKSELVKIYNRAKVHVLPSWFETTGLSSLEAGAMGCNLVVGDRGDVREYFDGFAEFCEPGDIESIRTAVLNAYNKPVNINLRKHILENYTWQKAAQKTLEAYQWVIENKR